MQQDLKQYYLEKAEVLRTEAATLRSRTRSFVVAELVSFALTVGLVIAYALTDGGWTLLVFMAFVALAYLWIRSLDVRSSTRLEECEAWLAVYGGELAALEGDFSHFDDGTQFVDAKHPFSLDLDVFGPESLFHRMNRTITSGGSEHLAALLAETRVPTADEVAHWRDAIKELSEKETVRTAFIAKGQKEHIDTKAVLQTLADMQAIPIPAFAASTLVFGMSVVLIAGFYALLLAAILGLVSAGAVMAWAMLEVLMACLFCARPLQKTGRAAGGILRQLRVYRQLVEHCVEQGAMNRTSPTQAFRSLENDEPTKAFHSLEDIVASIDRRNEFWIFLSNALFMADVFIIRRFLTWRARHQQHIAEWIDGVSHYDALVSLATFRFNHPEATDPEIVNPSQALVLGGIPAEAPILFSATALWHPFLGTKAVRNDFRIEDGHYYIITGANMAGKSTFLRAVGINILLARIGLPVFAEHLRLSLFALFTSMRTTDDLQHGISYFNAELLRLDQLLQAVKDSPSSMLRCHRNSPPLTHPRTLIILDEILKGTNSLDKLNGSRLFLETIADLPVTGIVATHDLELSRMADVHPDRFRNYCFEIQLSAPITYSYRITPGVARNQNATHLLRQLLASANLSKMQKP